ncbi:MAG TPA: UDP-N-acetylmuramoyl-L-alanyl-D-glutamate--2,6-diaminopimelate ligase, partial [Prolixibacteraceae bacterium]|nr:UDP-N-acetylmuramoyl-L-alanyl-D-glutamate--2,6-diaminopimelate ligase [Prolixibacteraceae bacterium]
MIQLKELINHIDVLQIEGNTDQEILGLAFDSRKVEAGFLFFAVKGTHTDGHQFLHAALDKGAVAIVCEQTPENCPPNVACIRVEDSSLAMGKMAAAFYGNPSLRLILVGVTGTNGKTTIATLLYRMVREMGFKAGLISTIVYRIDDRSLPASHTTPDPLQLQSLLKQMADEGCAYCFMEVSSHAVDQKRIEGLRFTGGIFTNLTHDHLDYHKTFDAYLKAKKQFFDALGPEAFALSNSDDKNGPVMLQNTGARKHDYSTRTLADFRGKILESHFDGTLMQINGKEVWTQFVGSFNAYNLLAVYGALCLLDFDPEKVLLALSKMVPVDGRFELIRSAGGIYVVVDYAHTPDALRNVLSTIDALRT